MTPTDALTYGGVFALLTASLAACDLAVRHASRLDPIAVLRQD